MKAEYRVVCSKFREPGHGLHHQAKEDKRTAVQSVIYRNAEAAKQEFYYFCSAEAPFQMQMRQVTEWRNTP